MGRSLHIVSGGQTRVLVDIDFDDLSFGKLAGEFFSDAVLNLAWPTPIGMEIDEHGNRRSQRQILVQMLTTDGAAP